MSRTKSRRKKGGKNPHQNSTMEKVEEHNEISGTIDVHSPNEQSLTEDNYLKEEAFAPTSEPAHPHPDPETEVTPTAEQLTHRIHALRRARLRISSRLSSSTMTLYPKIVCADKELDKMRDMLARESEAADLEELWEEAQSEQILGIVSLIAAEKCAQEHIIAHTEEEIKLEDEGEGEDGEDVFWRFDD